MSLSDVFNQFKTSLESIGYTVYTHPVDKISENICFLDIGGIDVDKEFTGGYEVTVDVRILLFMKDRAEALDKLESIVKAIDTSFAEFKGVAVQNHAENILVELNYKYQGVIYVE